MRFDDMVLHPASHSGPHGWGTFVRQSAIAEQHEADMATEVACLADHLEYGVWGYDPNWKCPLCLGTGRVTLGRIVEADRARKVKV